MPRPEGYGLIFGNNDEKKESVGCALFLFLYLRRYPLRPWLQAVKRICIYGRAVLYSQLKNPLSRAVEGRAL
jgi:hypothetical protein